MKYNQYKIWPTRRIHMFQGNDKVSICGLALAVAGDKAGVVDFGEQDWFHPYDDLNYCQCCRRAALHAHGKQYTPLSQKYAHLINKTVKVKA